jgi:hypothetical protein
LKRASPADRNADLPVQKVIKAGGSTDSLGAAAIIFLRRRKNDFFYFLSTPLLQNGSINSGKSQKIIDKTAKLGTICLTNLLYGILWRISL